MLGAKIRLGQVYTGHLVLQLQAEIMVGRNNFNMERQIYIPPGEPPRVTSPSAEIYAQMGEANVFAMLEDFYRELEKSSVRSMFPKDMVEASKKSAACRGRSLPWSPA